MRFLFIAALILVGAYLVRRLQGASKMPSSLVKQKIDAGATIIDVRTPEEFRDGAYPGAINIPVSNLGARIGEIPKGKPWCSTAPLARAAPPPPGR